jgi:hypothetical protein
VSFLTDNDRKALLPQSRKVVGADVGILSFAMFSDDSKIGNSRFIRANEGVSKGSKETIEATDRKPSQKEGKESSFSCLRKDYQ